ncbi:MAG: SufD family Fe-S cluster assembly protein, partial [Alphaproteobacteria bacterium]|nr:SufD family Fe-S cluster assembly protein [Alphaproteobacteria bacterium]
MDTLPFIDRHAEALARLGGPGWIADLRRTGLERYRALGLPTQRDEAWKYTNLSALKKIAFAPAFLAAAPSFDGLPVLGGSMAGESCRFVMVNGRFAPALSSLGDLPPGIGVSSLAAMMRDEPDALESFVARLYPAEGQPLANLNAAYLDDGVVIRIAAGASLGKPVHVVSLCGAGLAPLMCHPRLLVVAEAGSTAAVVESRLGFGGGSTLCNVVTDVVVEDEATLGHYVLQKGSDDNRILSSTRVDVRAGGLYES